MPTSLSPTVIDMIKHTRVKHISPKGVFFALSARCSLDVRSVRLRSLRFEIPKKYALSGACSFWEQKKALDKEAERRRTQVLQVRVLQYQDFLSPKNLMEVRLSYA